MIEMGNGGLAGERGPYSYIGLIILKHDSDTFQIKAVYHKPVNKTDSDKTDSSFGWKVEKSQPAIEKHVWGPLRVMATPLALLPGRFFKNMVQDHESRGKVERKLKRDKQIRNKNERNRLQVTMEETLSEMEHMEATQILGASVGAYVAGLLGTVCMGFAVFGYLGANMTAWVSSAVSVLFAVCLSGLSSVGRH